MLGDRSPGGSVSGFSSDETASSRFRDDGDHAVSMVGLCVCAGLLVLGAAFNTWDWFAAARMPYGDFPGYAAQVQYVQQSLLEHGRVPLWCGECYGGTTNFTGHLKEVLAFPIAVWGDPVLATKLAHVLLRIAGGLGLYALVVRLFGAPGVGMVVAYAHAFAAIANHQLEHLDMALAGALAPGILLAAVELLRSGGWRWALALGVLVACQLVNNWVYAFPAPFVVLALLALRPWQPRPGEGSPWRDRPLATRQATQLLLAGCVFLLFAGSQLAWLATDARHHRLVPERSLDSLRTIYIERSPFLFVNRDNVLGAWLEEHHPPDLDVASWDQGRRYLGVVPLALCLAGWLAVRRRDGLRRWALAAGGMFLLQYWLALGPRTLLWEVGTSLNATPNGIDALRTGLRAGAGLCVALAAGGWLAARRWERAASLGRARGALLVAALLLFFPTQSLWSPLTRVLPLLEVQRSPGHFFDTANFWLCLLFAVSLVALQRSLGRPRLARVLLACVGLAVVVDFAPSRRAFSAGARLDELQETAAMLQRLEGEDGSLRLLPPRAYSPLDSWLAASADPGHAWGWLPWQAGRHWSEYIVAAAWQKKPGEERAPTPSAPLLGVGRVRYLLIPAEEASALPSPWQRVDGDARFSVWQLPEVAPFATLHRDAVLLADPLHPDVPGLVGRSIAENALVISAGGDWADYRERAREVLLPGGRWWRAEVDGSPVPAVRSQMAFMAVPVGPGSHRVDLRLVRPGLVAAADRVTAGAWLALAFALLVAGIVRWRRRRPGSRTPSGSVA
jgi:hypothetical protein